MQPLSKGCWLGSLLQICHKVAAATTAWRVVKWQSLCWQLSHRVIHTHTHTVCIDSFLSLVAIAWIPHVSCLALALESTNLIDAQLGTDTRLLALIDIHTGVAIGGELVSLMALADIANQVIHAFMHAVAILGGALVHFTFTRWLILAVRTVLVLVTDLGQRNALATSTVKLAGRVAALGLCCQSAVAFIAAIRTVRLLIAGKMPGNTAAISTLELIWSAGNISAIC